MPSRDIIVVGASAGGVEALTQMVRGLPASLPASFFIVCHFPSGGRSVLPQILSRSGPLLAVHAADGEPFLPGQIYVAPPDHHLLLGPDGRMRLTRGARENHHRPAVDPLFRSAARYYGPRVIGVVLSGSLYDGTAGLMAVRTAGGLAVVQDPGDAMVAAMPENAIQLAGGDHVVRIAELAPLLVRLINDPNDPERRTTSMDPIERMPDAAAEDMAQQARNERRGEVSVMTCPECGGSLWQVDDPDLIRFRCHVGHVYGGEVLLSEQSEALEAALWTAVRTFKEKFVLASQLANKEETDGNLHVAARFREQADQAIRFGELIQQYLLTGGPPEIAPVPGRRDDGGVDGPPIQNSVP
jgi:two-component system chemotaxis response regulator CheB